MALGLGPLSNRDLSSGEVRAGRHLWMTGSNSVKCAHKGSLIDKYASQKKESTLENVGRESEKAKQPSFGICGIRSIWLQVPSFPRARPRMYRREVWVAAINLIEAHSHTLCSF